MEKKPKYYTYFSIEFGKKSIPTYYRVIQMDLLKINEGKYDLVMNYESRSKVIHETHFFQSLSVSVAKFEMSKQ